MSHRPEIATETGCCKDAQRAVFAAAIVFSLALVLQLCAVAQAPSKPLSKSEVVRLLKGDVTPKRVAEMARERGIDFQITPEVEKELRAAGADDALITTLRELATPTKTDPKALSPEAQRETKRAVKPISEHELVRLLKGDVRPSRVAELVRERGIDFPMTPESEQEIRSAGGDGVLLADLRAAGLKTAQASSGVTHSEAVYLQISREFAEAGKYDLAIRECESGLKEHPQSNRLRQCVKAAGQEKAEENQVLSHP